MKNRTPRPKQPSAVWQIINCALIIGAALLMLPLLGISGLWRAVR